MVIDEFNTDIATNFYSDITLKLELLTENSIEEIFSEYHRALIKFKEDNQVLLNDNPDFISRTQKYYDDLISIKMKVAKSIEYSQEIAKLINKLISHPSAIDIGIDLFSIMECWFLRRDVKVFYINMESLENSSGILLILNIISQLF